MKYIVGVALLFMIYVIHGVNKREKGFRPLSHSQLQSIWKRTTGDE